MAVKRKRKAKRKRVPRRLASRRISRAGGAGSKAVAFFQKQMGGAKRPGESWATARRRGAHALAHAETEAARRGWWFDWQEDPYASDNEYEGAEDNDHFIVTLRDEEGNALDTMGGVAFSKRGSSMEDRNYRRVVEAEMAAEALHSKESR